MALTITGTVDGIPAPMGSHKHIGRGRIINDNPRTAEWQNAVRWSFRQAYRGEPTAGCVMVILTFYFPHNKGHYGTGRNAGKLKPSAPIGCTYKVKPDLDKLVRAVLDCGTGILWVDDAQVVHLTCQKEWSESPRMEFDITLDVWEEGVL